MDKSIIEKYFITPGREKKIWDECIFVFDTSALLNFYNYSPETKSFLFAKIFPMLKDRLWLPNHVEFEYLKNREHTLKNPITEKYGKLIDEEINSLLDLSKRFDNQYISLKNRTKKKFAHPYFKDSIYKPFDILYEKFKPEIDKLFKNIETEISLRKKEILELEKNDDVLASIEAHFNSGKSFSFEQLLNIAKEGEFRYKHKIPPGYEDLDGKNKKIGIQAYGDLIIWKQILEYARIITKPLVLITDDVKSDWCYIEKSGSDTRITRPKEELIKEMSDFASVDFWMYTLSQFVHNTEKYLNIKPNEEIIEDIEMNAKNHNILFDEFYINQSGRNTFSCIKFFEDGEIIYVYLGADIRKESVQNDVNKWFKKGYTTKGKYSIFENLIEFETSGTYNIQYKGKIIDGDLHLEDLTSETSKPKIYKLIKQ